MTLQVTNSLYYKTEHCYSGTHDSQRRVLPVDGDKSLTVPIHSLWNSWHCHKLHAWYKQRMKTCHTLTCSIPCTSLMLEVGQKFGSENATLGSSSLGQEEHGAYTM
ncbi:hypothetical protein A6R68_21935 [Neotoma lepida]|uniref:Uncharacterized protein n=1 Tax=Neotoma lepida TaxID=56216 RepID=A0A1A6HQ65_NEOLE|nr:hypothetical protein A6R68_21935 [Neotoma lepida]